MFEMEAVGPTEGVIMGLMEFLVDPLLPSKFSSSPSLQQLLAKQFHAVVLLYNYYHIQQYPELEFLEFESFCKLIVALKPSLLPYFKLMQQADYTEADNLDKQPSLIEKAIIKSCNICRSLDASKTHPVIKGWPITKVTVFLVDEKKENCCLFHSSITQGVWSAIEKDVKDRNQAANIGSLRQLAFLAVKEACGINEVDLRTLETHVIYSIGKEKTAGRLYIMQCWKTNKNMNLIPIKDVLESMQGPLVVQDSDSWITTSVVEYFHLLPLIDEVSDWFSRKDLVNPSQPIGLEKKDRNNSHYRKVAMPADKKHFEGIDEIEGDRDFELQVKPVTSSLDHSETVKNVENLNSFPLKVEKVASTLHFEGEKKAEDLCSSQSHVKPLAKRNLHHFETVEDFKKDCSYYEESPEEIKPPSKTSDHFEKVTEAEKYSGSHLGAEQLVKTSHHKVVKEAEIYQCSNLEVKPEPHTTYLAELVEEDQNYTCSHLDEGPDSKTSHHFEAAEVVVSCNSSHMEEEKPRESLQSSPVAMEVRVGYCNHIKKEVPEYSSHHSEAARDQKCKGDLYRQVGRCETLVYKKRNRSQMNCNSDDAGFKISNSVAEYPRHEDEKCAKIGSMDNMFFNSYTVHASVDGKSKILTHEGHDDDQKQIVMAETHNQTSMTGQAILEGEGFDNLQNSHENRIIEVFSDNMMSDNAMPDQVVKQDLALVSFNSDLEHLHKLQLIIASKDAMLSQAALKVLYRKKEILSQQHRCMADEITSCDRNIQTILSGEDDLAIKLQTVIDGCDDISSRSITTTADRCLLLLDKGMPPDMKRKTLSDANLFVHSPCQELDGVCSENYWILPTYHVSAFKGGYQASVSIKEIDFECSSEGALCQTPVEARNSAASNLLVKLRSMVAAS